MPLENKLRTTLKGLFGIALIGTLAACGGSDNDDEPDAKISQGKVIGVQEDGMQSFKGIRYAPAPEGERRWAPPGEPPAFSEGSHVADEFGDACPQAGGQFGDTSLEEDCLFLNVYTPDTDSGPYPVMVWIHGGAFVVGSGGEGYPPSRLVSEDLVVVTLNYRLGALGFLPHSSLADTNGDIGNYGLMDQQAALQWVQDNIGAFGGNPNNVTIFGESAGGHSVLSHVASPQSEGLFHKAIAQSGSYNASQLPLSAAEATFGTSLVQGVGCADAADVEACLRETDVQTLLEAQGGNYLPVTGTEILPESIQADLTDADEEVPLMLGSNYHEGRLFVALDIAGGTVLDTVEAYNTAVDTLLATDPRDLDTAAIADYYLNEFSDEPGPALYHKAYAKIQTDWRFACPGLGHLNAVADNGNTVYGYWFTDEEAPHDLEPVAQQGGFDLGAAHSLEIQYVFDSLLGRDHAQDQLALSETMIDYWTAFAKNGEPISQTAVSTAWPTFNAGSALMELDVGTLATRSAGDFGAYHDCSYWATAPTTNQ